MGTHPGAVNPKDRKRANNPTRGDRWIHNCFDYDNNNNPGDLLNVSIRRNRVRHWGNLGIAIACGLPTHGRAQRIDVSSNVLGDATLPYPQRQAIHFEKWCVNVTVINNTITQTAGNSPMCPVVAAGSLLVANNTFANCTAMGNHARAPCLSVTMGTDTHCGSQGGITHVSITNNSFVNNTRCANGIIVASSPGCPEPPFAPHASVRVEANLVLALENGTGIAVKQRTVSTVDVSQNRIRGTNIGILVDGEGGDENRQNLLSSTSSRNITIAENSLTRVTQCIVSPSSSHIYNNTCSHTQHYEAYPKR